MKTNYFLMVVSGLATLAMLLSSCGSPVEAEEPVEQPFQTVAPTATGVPEPEKFTVGISNPITNKLYHTQMLDDLMLVNQEYVEAGIANELLIESADTDIKGQIQQLENLMDMNVDAIIFYPLSVTDLNSTLEKAVAEGILVISVDREVDVPGVYTVGIDHKDAGMKSAEWLAKWLIGSGNIVIIEGSSDDPTNIARLDGLDEVLNQYPGITVLARENGNFDQETSQKIMSDLLVTYPDLDGYWTQDGMAIGALKAIRVSNLTDWPKGIGECSCEYINLWVDTASNINPNFDIIAACDHSGVAATALRIAYNMLQGKVVDTTKLGGSNGMKFVVPTLVLERANSPAAVWMCHRKPSEYFFDNIMDENKVQWYFTSVTSGE